MSKKQFKSQASSSRAGFGQSSAAFGSGAFSSGTAAFGSGSSPLSYLAEQPDLSLLSDPNIVVSFKNLSKKDSTTKAKALEELQAWVLARQSAQEQIEEGFLDAWVKLYPRTSIDVARRVRQLSHAVHGQVSAHCGKRIARYLPHTIGAWLSGLYDGDKVVSRAAQDALNQTFPTQEKRDQLVKAYQSQLVEFSRDAILFETPQTLSDERNTTKEDSEAKFTRVVSCNISVIADLLTRLDDDTISKCRPIYEEVTGDAKTWEFVWSNDTQLRRAVLRLAKLCVSNHKDLLEPHISAVAEALLSKQALRNQTGSSTEFVDTLSQLTEKYPSLWELKRSKNSLLDRFQGLVKHGSQGGPAQFWDAVSNLFDLLPKDSIRNDSEAIRKTLEVLHSGIARKDEPRTNNESGWFCYLKVAQTALGLLSDDEATKTVSDLVLPIVQQYVAPDRDNADWVIPANRTVGILGRILRMPLVASAVPEKWPEFSNALIERIQTSQPEQSKDYEKSQDLVKTESTRWFILQAETLRQAGATPAKEAVVATTKAILERSAKLLESRRGKPYGAAAAIEAASKYLARLIREEEPIRQILDHYLLQQVPDLVMTPSATYAVSTLYNMADASTSFSEAWNETLTSLLEEQDSAGKFRGLQTFLDPSQMPPNFRLPAESQYLQEFIVRQAEKALSGAGPWPLFFEHRSASGLVASETYDKVLADLTAGLRLEEQQQNALSGLSLMVKGDQSSLRSLLSSSKGAEVIQSLLKITESTSEEDAQTAVDLSARVQQILKSDQVSTDSNASVFSVIQRGLAEVDESSLAIPTLVGLAKGLLEENTESTLEAAVKVLPSSNSWLEALTPFLIQKPPSCLAISSNLSGAVFVVKSGPSPKIPILRDVDGLSAALRISWYVVALFKESKALAVVPDESLLDIYCLLQLTIHLASDQVGLRDASGLWLHHSESLDEDIADLVSEAQSITNQWIKDHGLDRESFVERAHDMMISGSAETLPIAYHNAVVYAQSVSTLLDLHGTNRHTTEDLDNKLRALRKVGDTLPVVAFLKGFSQVLSNSTYVARLCNELIADLTGLDMQAKSEVVLEDLVILNTILQEHDEILDNVAKQRLVFLIKHVNKWLEAESCTPEIQTEILKTLNAIYPYLLDLYGEHWSASLGYLKQLWSKEGDVSSYGPYIPLYHTSLKLLSTLGSLAHDEDANDDLQDTWKEEKDAMATALMGLLRKLSGLTDSHNQPLRTLNELLARQVSVMRPEDVGDFGILYSLIASESGAVQRTAFDILHRQIPKAQEQISLDSALDKKAARLPDELLSLIIQVPSDGESSATGAEKELPAPLRAYLSSWLLVFDHFRNASEKVQSDYIAHIKEGGHLDDLLNLIFTALGHSRGKPIDASKFDVTTYGFDIQDSPSRDIQWLLSHLYFQSLRRMPNLTKTWWRDSASRQTKINVESWTEKYISPHVITDALDTVEAWARTQDSHADDALIIKVNRITREVTASKEIDEQFMTVVVRLQSDFPLSQATVEGTNRVAIAEKKWQSWLVNCQGVITFSNNSLIEGLTTFRRNLAAALKGHTECAICYSLVASDKQLPTKKCTTCKNLFHGSCLFRWFKSSNSSSCPLCRNPFNYS